MESLKMSEHKPDDESQNKQIESSHNLHEQALQFVESHRQVFEHYARGAIAIEPAPKGLNTFAFNLEKNTIYIHPMFYKELGLSEERTVFATLHEIEHFLEKKQVLGLEDGSKRYGQYIERIKKSRAFGLTDNCVADIYVNRSVVSKTNQAMGELERGMYTEVLFKETDFTSAPKHIQFAQALLRESRVPDEQCIVDPLVRERLKYIENFKSKKTGRYLMDSMTSPDTSVVDRWELQDRFIIPIIEELKQKDIEEEKQKRLDQNQEKQNQEDNSENEDNENGENQDGEGESDESNTQEAETNSEDGENSTEEKDGQQTKDKIKKRKSQNKQDNAEIEQENSDQELESLDFDPNEIWKDEYDKAEQATPNAISEEEIEKAIEEYERWKKEHVKSEKEIQEELDQEYAEKIGVSKQELQQYRETVKKLEQVINPESGRSVIEELRDIIKRIVAKRKNKKFTPQYPVEEGDYLIEPAELVASVKAGNLHPKVWEVNELKESNSDKFGEVEISFVCDRSGSMDGQKLIEQRKAMILAMEALKELSDLCRIEKSNMTKSLDVKHEVYTFQATDEDSKPQKIMSSDSTETDRIKTASALSSCPGSSTTDFIPIEAIEGRMDEKIKRKIKEGELKKIIFVMTDGDSDDASRVKRVISKMRDDGVIIIGIGITNGGASALETYAPTAQLAETAEKLPAVLAEALKEHLTEI